MGRFFTIEFDLGGLGIKLGSNWARSIVLRSIDIFGGIDWDRGCFDRGSFTDSWLLLATSDGSGNTASMYVLKRPTSESDWPEDDASSGGSTTVGEAENKI